MNNFKVEYKKRNYFLYEDEIYNINNILYVNKCDFLESDMYEINIYYNNDYFTKRFNIKKERDFLFDCLVEFLEPVRLKNA